MYIILFLLQNYRYIKKNFLNLKIYINRIFTPERVHYQALHYQALYKIMTQKALPSVLLQKIEVTYRDIAYPKIEEVENNKFY